MKGINARNLINVIGQFKLHGPVFRIQDMPLFTLFGDERVIRHGEADEETVFVRIAARIFLVEQTGQIDGAAVPAAYLEHDGGRRAPFDDDRIRFIVRDAAVIPILVLANRARSLIHR